MSQKIATSVANKSGQAYSDAKKAEQAKLEKTCATSDDVRCEVVALYEGARHHLYKYQRYQDVRLVFAPEVAIAFFGGDPDNFNFPRYDLDVSFVRIYSGGKPAKVEHYFPFSPQGAKEGQLTFTSGHPGHTSRDFTVLELLFERRYVLPRRLQLLSELRGQLIEFAHRGKEQERFSRGLLFGIENSFKAIKGRFDALMEPSLIDEKRSRDKTMRIKLGKDKRPGYATAFASIDKALATRAETYDGYSLLEQGRAFPGDLFGIARTLVRAAEELPKPNELRLTEFVDSALPELKQELFSPAPIHSELEQLEL